MRSSGGNGAALVLTAFFSAPRLAAVLGTVSLTPLPETARIEMRVTAMTIQVPMLMYGKEASNRKQEIDRQHYTIPNQRPKDKHCGKI